MERFAPFVRRATLLLAGALLVVMPVWAQEEPPESDPVEGSDHAAAVITASLERQLAHLGGLLEQVPEQAHPGIMRAMEGIEQGLARALAALAAGEEPPDPEPEPGTAQAADDETGPDAIGRERARQAITDSSQRAQTALSRAIENASEAAQPHLAAALEAVGTGHVRALAALEGPPERPERPDIPAAPERPERPELPDIPAAPERPDLPELPDIPAAPERPERPDVPQPPL